MRLWGWNGRERCPTWFVRMDGDIVDRWAIWKDWRGRKTILFLRANILNSSYPVRLTGLGIDTFNILSPTPLAGRTIPRTFCFGTSTSDARPICSFSLGILRSVFSYLFSLLFGCRRIARAYQTQPCTISTLSRPFVAFHLDIFQ